MATKTANPLAQNLMHGTDWAGQDLTGWSITEKYDGVRALWTGRELVTRQGLVIDAPAELVKGLPALMALDCEIWIGRGRYEEARLAVQAGRWTGEEKLMVFDTPFQLGTYAQRMEAVAHALLETVELNERVRTVLWSGPAVNNAQVMVALATIVRNGGEGLMVRAPAAHYRPGRSGMLLKLKADALELNAELQAEAALLTA